MIKPYLKGIVRNGGKGKQGVGIEMFRLDSIDDEDVALTEQEEEIASETKDKSSTAMIRVYEEIGQNFWSGEGVTTKSFAKQLDDLGSIKKLNIHVNCLGGDAFTAQAMYNIIQDHSADKKTSYIDGVAASAATIICCGADEVIARHNTNYMVHHPWAVNVGNAESMLKAANDLEKLTIPIVSVYKNKVKGKIGEPKIRQLMDEETWMSADEALEYGFVDKVRGKIKAIAKVGKFQIFCSGKTLDIGKYHYQNVPDYPTIKLESENKPMSEPTPTVTTTVTASIADLTVDMLAKDNPTLVANIRASERKRISDLDAMMAPGLENIISSAKTDGRYPSDIAMECFTITKENVVNLQNVNSQRRDAQAAGNVPAGDAPLVKPEGEPSQTKKGTNLMTEAFKNSNNKRGIRPAMNGGN